MARQKKEKTIGPTEIKPVGPIETKPTGPTETKVDGKPVPQPVKSSTSGKVEIVGTGKDNALGKDKTFHVGSASAKNYIKMGWATEK